MKLFASVFSLYILVLLAVPCMDTHSSGMNTGIVAATNETHNHSGDMDQCSPFCSCICCAASIVYPEFKVDFFSSDFFEKVTPSKALSFIPVSLNSIFQPPNIG
jgi:hypothetical protein